MPVPIVVVDAFANGPFTGNPAAVCRLEAWPDDQWLRSVAAEMNLAETAFLVPRTDGDIDLRWFTPTVEIDLCGHATLASAHVLQHDGPVRFHTRSGVLTCTLHGDVVELDFPANIGSSVPLDPALVETLGCVVRATSAGAFLLAEVASADVVCTLQPDMSGIAAAHPHGMIVTARASAEHPDCDFVSRVFAPNAGIPEDPVTGSAHCQLATYWGSRLGKTELRGYQASKRGGLVGMRIKGDRVVLSGNAVTVWEGSLLV